MRQRPEPGIGRFGLVRADVVPAPVEHLWFECQGGVVILNVVAAGASP